MNVETKKVQAQVYTYQEALAFSTGYFKGDVLAATTWMNKYALRANDASGEDALFLEKDPSEMHWRMAKEFARAYVTYLPNLAALEPHRDAQFFYAHLHNFETIIPQGSIMYGLGNPLPVSLSNCFVIDNGGEDSYGSIFKMDEMQAQLMKRRGGVGHDISAYRYAGSPVNNSARTSTGAGTWMHRFSNTTREVAQDGRRGALMLSIDVHHPDIRTFVTIKSDRTSVTGANISVRITDDFMQAVDGEYTYDLIFQGETIATIEAKPIWDLIIHHAWKDAEPGMLYWDTILHESPADCYADDGFKTVSTNPCGEIPLSPFDSCRLVALNLTGVVGKPFEDASYISWQSLQHNVFEATIMSDLIVSLEIEKVEQIMQKIGSATQERDETVFTELNLWRKIKEAAEKGRRTGLGITGEGDMLAMLGLKYGSEEGNQFAELVHHAIAVANLEMSTKLAEIEEPFSVWNYHQEKDNPYLNRVLFTEADSLDGMRYLSERFTGGYNQRFNDKNKIISRWKETGRRNIASLTIAPTGTVSLMAQTSSGLENVFSFGYDRKRKVMDTGAIGENELRTNPKYSVDESGDWWERFSVVHHNLAKEMKVRFGIKELDLVLHKEYLDKSYYAGTTAIDGQLDYLGKVKLQATVQKWIDHSISVTINLPNDVDEQLVSEIYMQGWKLGCKGMTVYRDGCRTGVLVQSDAKEEAGFNGENEIARPTRPDVLEARVLRFQNEDAEWVSVVGLLEGKPYEIFTGHLKDGFAALQFVDTGKVIRVRTEEGSRFDFQYTDSQGYNTTIEGLSRCFDPKYYDAAIFISGMLRMGMQVHKVVKLLEDLQSFGEGIFTWKAGVIRSLKMYIQDGTLAKGVCPECKEASLRYMEGCVSCSNCGHSKC